MNGLRSTVLHVQRRFAWLIASLVGGACLFLGSHHAMARTFLVAIGNNHGHAYEQPLLYAEKDALSVLTVLQRFGGAHPRDSVLVQGRDATEVLDALDNLKVRISRLSAKEQSATKLVVYYSGHADVGGLHPGKSRIPYAVLRQKMQSVPAAVRLLVVDGCRSGGLTRVKGATPVAPFSVASENQLQTSGFAMISSSTATEDSHESEDLGGSFFTHHFLTALRGVADLNQDGRVSLRESYDYAYHQTLRSSSSTLSLQHPTIESRLRGRGDLMLSTPALARATTGAIILDEASVYLVHQDRAQGSVVAELQTQRPGQMLRLAPGSYRVVQRKPRQLRSYQVKLVAGRAVHLDPNNAEIVAYEQLVRKGGAVKSSNTLALSLGMRGPLKHQSRWSPQIVLGYTLHLTHLSISARARMGQGRFRHVGAASALVTRELEVGLGLSVERYVDFRRVSLGFGLWSEGLYFRQSTQAHQLEPPRHSFGAVIGGTLALQVQLSARLGLRFEVGPATYLLRRSEIKGGAERAVSIHTPFTGFANFGSYLRF